ncbi:bifunctional enzyme IspD/IspF [Devosia pacifica]|uniref:Bifunctional enzyme IspD/IspF n=1 Tax=Devosia pacifica TaxID=1335967 RepID=A0A918RUU4_9HYPH|nr:bifunctional 2-C-methyl-D-erythritol 4-phosphate cytidylyltransferase/2-C-methyl-D-erythritol 2,4-cyclodiphosphate synthase [Devosia pacifica]GHA11785.1 bifunctional enzyme IspD/IspF [Devosia pacifica]
MARPHTTALIVAAGKGARVDPSEDALPKQYRQLAGKAVLQRSIEAFLTLDYVDSVMVVINSEHVPLYNGLPVKHSGKLLPPVHGAQTRQESVLAGLEALVKIAPDLVLIHDAARPLVSQQVIGDVVAGLIRAQGCIPALPITETVKRSQNGDGIDATEDRRQLFTAQTPQGFKFKQILAAHRDASAIDRAFTDDAEIAEWADMPVSMVTGDRANMKITHPEDFVRAAQLLRGEALMETHIGSGYDVHSFEPGDAVWLAGVKIPHHAKLNGHSDADVALHALCDAIYGALGEGDIGTHFPPSDAQWKGASSTVFLEHASKLVEARRGRIVNLDVTIVCEAPKISPHVPEMREVISRSCGIGANRVAIKATTNEKLGFAGREEGIFAMATASIELPRQD